MSAPEKNYSHRDPGCQRRGHLLPWCAVSNHSHSLHCNSGGSQHPITMRRAGKKPGSVFAPGRECTGSAGIQTQDNCELVGSLARRFKMGFSFLSFYSLRSTLKILF